MCPNGCDSNSLKNGCKAKLNETSYTESGLESISSSHRMGDTPDSCSDFSQDGGSSVDCDSPRVSGLLLNSMNILEDYNTKSRSQNNCDESFLNSNMDSDVISKKELYLNGASILHEKNLSSSQDVEGSTSINTTKPSESSVDSYSPKSSSYDDLENNKPEKSIETENEVFVDDFEEFNTQSKVFCPKRATAKIVSMEITNENMNSSEIKEPVVSSPQINDDSLNIVFHSQPSKNKESFSNVITSTPEKIILRDVPPVEKIAEEMEKLILQQLEEEERAKEMLPKFPTTDLFVSPEQNLIAPPKMAEPPKEKPPPPPIVDNDASKEALRKERERLKQEQEALQREREEHRLKLLKEQEELLKNNPKTYVDPVLNKQSKSACSHKKVVQNDTWTQQKVVELP